MRITPDNLFIVSGSADKSMKIFDINKRQEVHHFQNIHEEAINTVAISTDNKFIVSGSSDKSIKIIDLSNRKEIH